MSFLLVPKSVTLTSVCRLSVCKGRYALPVHTARTYWCIFDTVCTGVKNASVYTGRKYGPYNKFGPYIRTVFTDTLRVWLNARAPYSGGCSVLFCSLAVLDPRVGHTMDVLSPFIFILSHSN